MATVVYDTQGTFSWTALASSVSAECWGGGAGGRGGSPPYIGGDGGGGGGYSKKSAITLTVGNSYSAVVGEGGASNSPGGDSSFVNTSTVLAKGGYNRYPGDAGSGVGDTKYSGGYGRTHPSSVGGAGGGSGGTGSNGNDAINQTAVAAVAGGGPSGGGGVVSRAGYSPISGPGGAGGGGAGANYAGYAGGLGWCGKVVITYFLTPTVTGLSVTSGPQPGGTSIVITGTNFTGASAVAFEENGNWSNPAAAFNVDSATQITCTSPAGNAAATVDVRVTTAGGQSATGAADHFTFVALPTVTGVSPSSGPTTGGAVVTVTGTGFTNATYFWFGTTLGTSLTVNSDTQITIISPAGTGTVHTQVLTTDRGYSDLSTGDNYTFKYPDRLPAVYLPGVPGSHYGMMTPRQTRRQRGW